MAGGQTASTDTERLCRNTDVSKFSQWFDISRFDCIYTAWYAEDLGLLRKRPQIFPGLLSESLLDGEGYVKVAH